MQYKLYIKNTKYKYIKLILLCIVIFVFLYNPINVFPLEPPYLSSNVIINIQWDSKSNIIRKAQGTDNWPLTWADDGHLYGAGGDGGGFGGSRASLWVARILGDPPIHSGENIKALAYGNGGKGKKASGMLMVDGILYMWVRNANLKGEHCQLAWSEDHGENWDWSQWTFTDFGYCVFLNYGKNYQGSRDNYVYMYSHNNPSAYTPANNMILTRVPKDLIASRNAYEFFTGLDNDNNPLWSSDIAQRGAVFTNSGLCLRSGISYNAALKRYFWWQQNPVNGVDTRFKGGFGIYDALEPWGPWTTVYFTENWDAGPGDAASFPTKWISEDGKIMYLVFAGNDSFAVRKATLAVFNLLH